MTHCQKSAANCSAIRFFLIKDNIYLVIFLSAADHITVRIKLNYYYVTVFYKNDLLDTLLQIVNSAVSRNQTAF